MGLPLGQTPSLDPRSCRVLLLALLCHGGEQGRYPVGDKVLSKSQTGTLEWKTAERRVQSTGHTLHEVLTTAERGPGQPRDASPRSRTRGDALTLAAPEVNRWTSFHNILLTCKVTMTTSCPKSSWIF